MAGFTENKLCLNPPQLHGRAGSGACETAVQAKSYQIPTIRLFSQYGTATGGIEHAAGLVTPLGTNPRGGDLRFGSRGRAGGGGGGKVRIWTFAEFGANGQFLTEMAGGTTPNTPMVPSQNRIYRE